MSRISESMGNPEENFGLQRVVPLLEPPLGLRHSDELQGAADGITRQASLLDDVSRVNANGGAGEKSIPAPNGGLLVRLKPLADARFVALSEPNSLGAEKFRALITRLDNLRKEQDLKSFQVTSSVAGEGKSLVAANMAITLAKYSNCKTLLIEGDLHRPSLAASMGLAELPGMGQWWADAGSELPQFVHQLDGMPLSFLPAGIPCDQPWEVLRSTRLADAFSQFSSQFEWIVVDSTPMLPIVDVNLWSKLVDGMLLVVREGFTPVKALQKGLRALDHPRLIGVVLNEASESDQASYEAQYYRGNTP